MPKSKKKKNKDFQKVKLKVGKKLSKGDNVTNLSFKTKQIQLTQKIRDGNVQEPVSKQKLTVQDLLRQCDHHGTTARANAISGLKELWLINHQELMQPYNKFGYGSILEKISTMFVDNEASVRHTVISLFKAIINKVSGGQGQPPKGFPMMHIHTFLCCAMNHVHEDIKLDALLIFDVLLDFLPNLLIEQTGDLLNNLLGFISAPICIGARADSTTQRLSLNPDSKLPIMQFRCRVLSRIKRLFQITVNARCRANKEGSSVKTQEQCKVWSIGADYDGANSRQNTFINTKQKQQRFSLLFSGACHVLDNYLAKPATIEYFITHSITVLLQCWREARASVDSNSVSDSIVSRDSAEVMSLVVSIIQLAFQLCGTKRLGSNSFSIHHDTLVSAELIMSLHALEFEKLFMNDFPYCVQVEASAGKKRKRKHADSQSQSVQFSVDNLNIGLCDIMCSFFACHKFQPDRKWCSKIQKFITDSFSKTLSGDHCTVMARCLNHILLAPATVGFFVPSFRTALSYFKHASVVSAQKKIIFHVFQGVCKMWIGLRNGDDQSGMSMRGLAEEFCSLLPDVVLSVITVRQDVDWALDILVIMRRARALDIAGLAEKILHLLPHFFDPSQGVLTCGSERVIQQMFSVVSLGTPLTKQHYSQLHHVLGSMQQQRRSCNMNVFVIESLYQNIHHLLPLTNQVDFHNITDLQRTYLSDFLDFMFSLLIGLSRETSAALSGVRMSASPCKLWDLDFAVDKDQWDTHVHIAQAVAKKLVNFHIPACQEEGYRTPISWTNRVDLLWINAFAGKSKIHIIASYSLLEYTRHWARAPDTVSDRTCLGSDMLELTSHLMVSLLVYIHNKHNDLSQVMMMVWKIKESLIDCLQHSKALLRLTWVSLSEMTQGQEYGRDSVATAKEFLLSDATIQSVIEENKLSL